MGGQIPLSDGCPRRGVEPGRHGVQAGKQEYGENWRELEECEAQCEYPIYQTLIPSRHHTWNVPN